METLKFWARLACQAMRRLVTKKVPRLPWSLDRFHTPVIYTYKRERLECEEHRAEVDTRGRRDRGWRWEGVSAPG
jgi:hypothetical protein